MQYSNNSIFQQVGIVPALNLNVVQYLLSTFQIQSHTILAITAVMLIDLDAIII